jgi:hypothetical protein
MEQARLGFDVTGIATAPSAMSSAEFNTDSVSNGEKTLTSRSVAGRESGAQFNSRPAKASPTRVGSCPASRIS